MNVATLTSYLPDGRPYQAVTIPEWLIPRAVCGANIWRDDALPRMLNMAVVANNREDMAPLTFAIHVPAEAVRPILPAFVPYTMPINHRGFHAPRPLAPDTVQVAIRERAKSVPSADIQYRPPFANVFANSKARLAWILERRQEGRTLKQIAAMLGCSAANVFDLFHKAKRYQNHPHPLYSMRKYARPIELPGQRDVWHEYHIGSPL